MRNENERKIFSRKLAVELRKKGFKIIRTEPNELHPKFDVFIFDNTTEFKKAVDELMG